MTEIIKMKFRTIIIAVIILGLFGSIIPLVFSTGPYSWYTPYGFRSLCGECTIADDATLKNLYFLASPPSGNPPPSVAAITSIDSASKDAAKTTCEDWASGSKAENCQQVVDEHLGSVGQSGETITIKMTYTTAGGSSLTKERDIYGCVWKQTFCKSDTDCKGANRKLGSMTDVSDSTTWKRPDSYCCACQNNVDDDCDNEMDTDSPDDPPYSDDSHCDPSYFMDETEHKPNSTSCYYMS